ncbi:MAG: transglycosylase domain-containing protein [Paracoccus sp. (in: a-proteobacteria)]|uniref:transglycosylase domain-containing protein n=1 Tax=Paracoccus sp. TaxID=267 RepID=UPI0026DFF8A4|nr:transglycosylase domain-containing protein [Paracoccus sp. (in: a-proteobacteria)]MDO5612392.1 transglycosylase domain-containing protein [Paracoccus sp. (in: a-proteobacteria)]
MKRPTGTPRRAGKGPVADKRDFATTEKPKRHTPRQKNRRGNMVTRGVAGMVVLVWRILWGSAWRLALVLALILFGATAYYYNTLPQAAALFDGRARGSVTMLDRDGGVFAWRGETFGTVSSDKIAPVLKNAVIATEDRRFYNHLGVDPRGIAGAMRNNIQAGRGAFEGAGGSTITVQVAKLLCLGQTFDPTQWKDEAEFEQDCRVSSLWRKVKEVPYAFALEAKYSKDEILNIYMNRSYLGAGARGFEAASQRYFNKPASDVTAPEAAMLAGALRAPSRYAPTANLQRAQDRANVILGLMHEEGYLNDAELTQARANPATLSRAAAARAGGYFADWVMDSGPGFLTSETTEDVTIRTTFDQGIQRAAERALARVFDEKVKDGSKAQAAVVVMSADGAVRAMIGGRDNVAAGTFNRATQAKRQTGSSFKPFVFAAALNAGYTPDSRVLDAPLTISIRGSAPWTPQNYTRRHRGEISLTTALANSINTATIRLQEAVGRAEVRRVAQAFGVASDLTTSPSLGLGASESTLLEMTGAYAGIRNGGTAVHPYGLIELRIKGDGAPLMGQAGGLGQQVISNRAAGQLIFMMEQVIQNGTGTRAKLPGNRPAAGKTGTTSSYRDAWFIGFTQQYVTGVWMGYDDNTPLNDVTGGGLPAEIWQAVMAEIHDGLPVEPLLAVSPDGGGLIILQGEGMPTVVTSGSAQDPLAAALAQAIAPEQASSATVTNAPAPPGTAPQTPASSTSAGSTPEVPADDALADALRGILN